tara:strand:- start:1066 stop:1374 length:309 start_codon:yes stop_codon:yes gene_type:complete
MKNESAFIKYVKFTMIPSALLHQLENTYRDTYRSVHIKYKNIPFILTASGDAKNGARNIQLRYISPKYTLDEIDRMFEDLRATLSHPSNEEKHIWDRLMKIG